jgi:hypothetical protein
LPVAAAKTDVERAARAEDVAHGDTPKTPLNRLADDAGVP